MKFYNIVCAMFIASSSMTVIGCGLLDNGVQKYDTLVDKDEVCNQKWSDYESNLQRRGDMIPQLVAVVKGSAAHEEDTLTAVVQARANATRPEIKLDSKSDDFSNPEKMAAFQKAQGGLSQALGRLMVVQESYPTLQANAAFHGLQVQIEGTENRLLRAREEYNKAAMSFNTELRHVSGKVMNPITGHEFKPRIYFTADEASKVAPKVDFSKPAPATSK
jgi:LemA protein